MMYFLQSQERSLEVNADENSIGINGQEQETVFLKIKVCCLHQ